MRKSTVAVGMVVELRDCNTALSSDLHWKGSRYNLVLDHVGTVLELPDVDGDVKVAFNNHRNPFTGKPFMYVHHTNLRRG